MTHTPDLPALKQTARAARDERLARALRKNLQRRKQQARAIADRERGGDCADILSGVALSSTSDGSGETTPN